MRKIHVVICLLVVALCFSACGGGAKAWKQKHAELAAVSTSYGIRSHDRNILIEAYSKTVLTFNGVQLSPSHALITELHKRLSAQSGNFDVPERLNSNIYERDKSEKGAMFSYMIEILYNDFDNKLYVSVLPMPIDAKVMLKNMQDNKYPKRSVLMTTCEGMNETQCSQAIASEALDIAMPDYERNKALFAK